MYAKQCHVFYGFAVVISLLALAALPTHAGGRVAIKGNVRTDDGTPICAMVLANGQYMFSCDGAGTFNLNVPLDENNQITVFSFADGFAPFRVTGEAGALPKMLRMEAAEPESPTISVTRSYVCGGQPNWLRVSGAIESEGGEPLCAMILSNGQHMFSCGNSLGYYDLEVPVDSKGEVTIFAFADGFEPYRYNNVVSGSACDVRTESIGGLTFRNELRDKGYSGVYAAVNCEIQVTATNATARPKSASISFRAWDTSGNYITLGTSALDFALRSGGTQTQSVPLVQVSQGNFGVIGALPCSNVGGWEINWEDTGVADL